MLGLVVLAGLVWDLTRAPSDQWTGRALLAGVHLYQDHLRGVLTPTGSRCRMVPSCSRYAATSLERHGALRGSWLTVRRLARCGPWTPRGTVDPPPPAPIDAGRAKP